MVDAPSYQWNPELVLREEGGGALIFNPESGDLKFVNRTGRALLGLIMDGKDATHWLDRLRKDFPDMPSERLRCDLDRFLKDLKEHRILLPTEQD